VVLALLLVPLQLVPLRALLHRLRQARKLHWFFRQLFDHPVVLLLG
jgi:hypothetical protein